MPATCGTSCVGTAGGDDTLHELFFFDVTDFDGGQHLGSVRHLVIEARRLTDAPPIPCFGGVPSDQLNNGAVSALQCPELDDLPEDAAAMIRHGEGAHTGHTLGYWDLDGVRYVVSVHGASDVSRRLIDELVAAVSPLEDSS